MTAPDRTVLDDLSDTVPEECPFCGETLIEEPRTDIEDLQSVRRAYTYLDHVEQEHRMQYYVTVVLARIYAVIQKLKP